MKIERKREMDKLYIVVRNDLEHGLQAAQACHALREFGEEHPEIDKKWYEDSKNIVILQAPSETDLHKLVATAQREEIPHAGFREPDLNDVLTAVALAPTAGRLLSNLPLAMR